MNLNEWAKSVGDECNHLIAISTDTTPRPVNRSWIVRDVKQAQELLHNLALAYGSSDFALFVCADADKVDADTACNLTNNVTYEDPSMIPLGIKIEKWGEMMRDQSSRRQLVVMPVSRFHQRIMRLMTTISDTDFCLFIEEPGNKFSAIANEYDDVLVCNGVSAELRTEVEEAGKRVWEEGNDHPQPKGGTPHNGDIVLGGIRVPCASITLDKKQRTISITSIIDTIKDRTCLQELLSRTESPNSEVAIHPHSPIHVSIISTNHTRSIDQPRTSILTIVSRASNIVGLGWVAWDAFVQRVDERAKSLRPTTHIANVDIREGELVVRGSDGGVLPTTKPINKSGRPTDDLTRTVAEMVWDEGRPPMYTDDMLSLANRIVDVVSAENAKAKEPTGRVGAEQASKEQADAGRLDELRGLLEKLNTSIADLTKKRLKVDADITPMREVLKDIAESRLPKVEGDGPVPSVLSVQEAQLVKSLLYGVALNDDILNKLNKSGHKAMLAIAPCTSEEANREWMRGALRELAESCVLMAKKEGGEGGGILSASELNRMPRDSNGWRVGYYDKSTKVVTIETREQTPIEQDVQTSPNKEHVDAKHPPTSRPIDAASSAPPILPTLHHVHDIEYFDGPILSEYRSGSGNVYVEKWCTTLEKEGKIRGQRFLVVRVNANRIADYISKRITMLELLVGASDDVGFLVDRVNGVKKETVIDQIVTTESVQFVRVSTLPSSYLPRPDARHDGSLRPGGVLGSSP